MKTITLTAEEHRLLLHAVGFTIASLSARRAPGDRTVQDELQALEANLTHQQDLHARVTSFCETQNNACFHGVSFGVPCSDCQLDTLEEDTQ